MADRLLKPESVAAVLDVSTRTVERLVKKGHLPQPHKVLGENRWFESEIQEYLLKLKMGLFKDDKETEDKTEV